MYIIYQTGDVFLANTYYGCLTLKPREFRALEPVDFYKAERSGFVDGIDAAGFPRIHHPFPPYRGGNLARVCGKSQLWNQFCGTCPEPGAAALTKLGGRGGLQQARASEHTKA